MPVAKRYRLRTGVSLPYAEWIHPGAVYVGQPVLDPVLRPSGSVQVFHPDNPALLEVLPRHLLEELPESPAA